MGEGTWLDVVATLQLPSQSSSAARARQFISDFCSAAGLSKDLCQTAALIVSELVTNAVVHGRTSARIEVHRPQDVLRVAVRDDNEQLPEVGESPSPDAVAGRGMIIVNALADRWGVEASDGGKAVWFELRLDSRPDDD